MRRLLISLWLCAAPLWAVEDVGLTEGQVLRRRGSLTIRTPQARVEVAGDALVAAVDGRMATVVFAGTAVVQGEGGQPITVRAGEFAVLSGTRAPTGPARLNVRQFEALLANGDLTVSDVPVPSAPSARSIVPPGLNGHAVANSPQALYTELAQVAAPGAAPGPPIAPPSASGSLLHLETLTVVAPAPDAPYDANTNSYMLSVDGGRLTADGRYHFPAGASASGRGDASPSPPQTSAQTQVLPLREAPALCTTCGGLIPGTATAVRELASP